MNRRRALLFASGAALCAVLPARAQQSNRVWRIGMLQATDRESNLDNLEAFRQGMQELGYAEGRQYVVEYRSADGHTGRFAELAVDLARLRVDLIVTRGTPATQAARDTGIPVVMAAIGEALGTAVVSSLAHPGGNVTGLSSFATELQAKRMEIFRELLPRAKRIAALFNMSNPSEPPQWAEAEKACRVLGLDARLFDVRAAESLAPAIRAAAGWRADGVVAGIDAVFLANRRGIADLVARHRIPAMYISREFVEAGGLMSYGVSYPHLYYRAAGFVHKIISGTRPGDIPVQQPTKFELVINLKASKALGITVPRALLVRADRVFE